MTRTHFHFRHVPREDIRPAPKGRAVRRLTHAIHQPLCSVAHLVREGLAQAVLRIQHLFRELNSSLALATPGDKGAVAGGPLQLMVPDQLELQRQLVGKDELIVLSEELRCKNSQSSLLLGPAGDESWPPQSGRSLLGRRRENASG
eukprot:scaffold13706_cov121-Isochrysis_galbana.AAC.11